MSRSAVWTRVAVATALLAVWAIVATRIIPGKEYDRGIYVSVAERLRAGDRLYVDVWDNKDPAFYWMLALARTLGPIGDIVLEVGWLVLACASAFLIARRLGVRTPIALAAAAVATPLLLTSGFYSAGNTHLPAIAMTLAAVGAMLWDRPVLSGLLLTCLAFLKLPLLPLAVALVLLVTLRRFSWKPLVRLSLAFLAGCALFVAVLALRGELTPYLAAQELNLTYSRTPFLINEATPVVSHLRRGLGVAGAGVFTMVCVIVFISWASSRREPASAGPDLRLLRELTAAALLGGLAILAVTGMWPQHAQVLYVSVVLCLVLVARHLQERSLPKLVSAVALGALAIVLSGGWLPETFASGPPVAARGPLAALTATSPETTALASEGASGRYARLGMHDDHGHAEGLGAWTLGCPRFHQYPFDDPELLDDAVECATRQPFLIVSDSVAPRDDGDRSAAWNAFVAKAEAALSRHYSCRAFPGGRVCRRA